MKVVLIHGWSDSEINMRPLASKISEELKQEVSILALGNYSSLNDNITFCDLASAMMQAWLAAKLPLTKKSVNIIVHSMGALVLRKWLLDYFDEKSHPINNCIMLAPANFGSALAHKGKALLSRIFKGNHSEHMFEVGEKLLTGLELGSDWLWEQSLADSFDRSFFNQDNILTTVIIAAKGNKGIAALVNEAGSDGVVRWSSSNLATEYYKLDFTTNDLQIEFKKSNNNIAFKIVDKCNHQTILHADQEVDHNVFSTIKHALRITKNDFFNWQQQCAKQNDLFFKIHNNTKKMQQCFVRVRNQYKQPVVDYCMVGCESNLDDHELTDHFQSQVQQNVHIYSSNSSYRCFYWDVDKFWSTNKPWELVMNFIAFPKFRSSTNDVGYADKNHAEYLWSISNQDLSNFMCGQKTCFLDVIIPKLHQGIFSIKTF